MLASDITWDRFADIHKNPAKAFENLCWSIFQYHYAHKDANFHANPNNPGIEIDPVLSADGLERISFQSKWLKKMDYSQIKSSVKQIIKHYSEKIDNMN